jgi:uncharacterized protein YbjT (DUF2867 family)
MADTDRVVAVTGATGRQGGAVTARLLADGWRVRALTRRPQSKAARRLAGLGAEVVGADLADRASLVRAFRGASGVYSVQNGMVGGFEAEVVHGCNVGDAAREAGVSHVVYGSAGTGDSGTGIASWESKLRVQEHLETLGLPLTVLRPTAFMELMTDKTFYPAVSTWRLMPMLTGADLPIAWICLDDLGAIAAKAFADPARYVGADLQLTADVRSNAECQQIWRTVMGRAPRRFPMPVWVFERMVGTDLTTMWRWLAAAGPRFDPAATREILPSASTVEEWLVRQARAGQASTK